MEFQLLTGIKYPLHMQGIQFTFDNQNEQSKGKNMVKNPYYLINGTPRNIKLVRERGEHVPGSLDCLCMFTYAKKKNGGLTPAIAFNAVAETYEHTDIQDVSAVRGTPMSWRSLPEGIRNIILQEYVQFWGNAEIAVPEKVQEKIAKERRERRVREREQLRQNLVLPTLTISTVDAGGVVQVQADMTALDDDGNRVAYFRPAKWKRVMQAMNGKEYHAEDIDGIAWNVKQL